MSSSRRRGRGEGCIRHRADGRWEAILNLGYVDGKRKVKPLYGRTRKEAAEKLRAAQASLDEGSLVRDERLTVGRWLDHWIENVLANRVGNGSLAESTYNSYRATVERHLKPGLGHLRLTKIAPSDVDVLISKKRNTTSRRGKPFAANSLRIIRSTLRKALRDAQKAGHVARNAADLSEPVSVSRRAGEWLDIEEARALLRSVEGDRLEALYVVILSLGLRRGEGLALAWDDIDLDRATVLIRRSLQRIGNKPAPDGTYPDGRNRLVFTSPKTESSWRTRRLTPQCVAALRRHKARQAEERLKATSWKDHGLVFTTPIGTPIDPDNFAKDFVKQCEAAGLGHRNVHQLRHSAVTILLAQGVPLHEVSDFVGHSSITVTKDIYGHLDPARGSAVSNVMGEALWGGSSSESAAPEPTGTTPSS